MVLCVAAMLVLSWLKIEQLVLVMLALIILKYAWSFCSKFDQI